MCVCVPLCCCRSRRRCRRFRRSGTRCHGHRFHRNSFLCRLWTLLCHHGYHCQSLCHHGYWTASPPALAALWPQWAANGDRPAMFPNGRTSLETKDFKQDCQSVEIYIFTFFHIYKKSTTYVEQMLGLLLFPPESPWLYQLGRQNKLPVRKTISMRWRVFQCLCQTDMVTYVHSY